MKNYIFALLAIAIFTQFSMAQSFEKTKNYQKFNGYFNFYYDDASDKIFLQVDELEKEFLYVYSLSSGIGSNDIGLDRGQLGNEQVVLFKKAGNKLLLIQPNLTFRAITENELERKSVEQAFAKYYNAKLLMLYPFPSQTLWCNAEVNGIKDLEGKKIRVYATTLGDFVEGAGGTSVTVAFSEVIPALEKGVVDCGITGTMSAYTANWQQVATHAYTLRVGWGLAFGAMNMDKWNSLPPEQQELMQTEIAALNERMWAETATEDGIAISCITGGDCEIGEKGGMKLVEPSDEDLAIRDRIAADVVLARWAERCGEDCAENWNNTVGKVLGMTAKAN